MDSNLNITPLQKELNESSQKLRQELFGNSNDQLTNVSRTLTQTSDSLSKIQKSIEETRDNIKINSLKQNIFSKVLYYKIF
ncbi:hypothetical protein GLOIN_2v1597005 [Rhizophagus irregularis DAOM 181602=DAOM 197198]|nr:hypothetical protein GLOIN_2v1597005 [Rhizophagus irregularis DAOM 181602=DAOM 197198]